MAADPDLSKPSISKSSIFWKAIRRISGGQSLTASLPNPSTPRATTIPLEGGIKVDAPPSCSGLAVGAVALEQFTPPQ